MDLNEPWQESDDELYRYDEEGLMEDAQDLFLSFRRDVRDYFERWEIVPGMCRVDAIYKRSKKAEDEYEEHKYQLSKICGEHASFNYDRFQFDFAMMYLSMVMGV